MKKDFETGKTAYITLDLEPDHAGYSPEAYECWQEEKLLDLLKLLKKYNIRLSIFVVTKSLKGHQRQINLFKNYRCEFYLHSHSHNLKYPDTMGEIKRGKKEFKKYFGKYPRGYRAPGGLISEKGLNYLNKEGFLFDSSVIPSFWPKFSFFLKPSRPYKDTASGIFEIPFSVVSPFRLVIALSWIKLFGLSLYKILFH